MGNTHHVLLYLDYYCASGVCYGRQMLHNMTVVWHTYAYTTPYGPPTFVSNFLGGVFA